MNIITPSVIRSNSVIAVRTNIERLCRPLNETYMSDMITTCFGNDDNHCATLLKRIYPIFVHGQHEWPQRLIILTALCDMFSDDAVSASEE